MGPLFAKGVKSKAASPPQESDGTCCQAPRVHNPKADPELLPEGPTPQQRLSASLSRAPGRWPLPIATRGGRSLGGRAGSMLDHGAYGRFPLSLAANPETRFARFPVNSSSARSVLTLYEGFVPGLAYGRGQDP